MFSLSLLLGACVFFKPEPPPLSITLPPAQAPSKELKLHIRLDEEDNLFLNEILVSESELRQKIQTEQQKSQKDQQKLVCIIEVAPSIPYEKVINIIDLLKQEGVDNFALAATPQ